MKQRDKDALKAIGWCFGISTALAVFVHVLNPPNDNATGIMIMACICCGYLMGRIAGDALHRHEKSKGPWDRPGT